MIIFSGVQPTGNLHLGNYLGAIKRFATLSANPEARSLFCVVDLHAITVKQDPALLRKQIREVAAAFIASGVDPVRNMVFAQSRVREHGELAWILNCTARVGWLDRMTQFKDKAGEGENAEKVSVGLYAYPVLMAADILLYKTTHVPVGQDQKQHLELARDIAQKFNKDFKSNVFRKPTAIIDGPATRIMNLKDATRKMSKSEESDMSRINLMDSADMIAKKIRGAQSDSGVLPDNEADLEAMPAANNLISIYAALNDETKADVLARFAGGQFSPLKEALTDLAVVKLEPISASMRRLLADHLFLDDLLLDGASRASEIAANTMTEVREIVGLG
jgi:tryptophanyl-tRNA synthetase